MYYIPSKDDVTISMNTASGIEELLIAMLLITACVVLQYCGFITMATLLLILVIVYYVTVAYVKFLFTQLKSGVKYKVEKYKIFTILYVNKSTVVFIPVRLVESTKEGLQLYTLTLYVKKGD